MDKLPISAVTTPFRSAEAAPSLSETLRVLWRRRWLIAGFVTVALVATLVALHVVESRYTARTLLTIEGRESNVVDLEAVMVGLSGDAETLRSEVEVIRSRGLIQKLVDRLQLGLYPEFNEMLREQGLVRGAVGDGLTWIGKVTGLSTDGFEFAEAGRTSDGDALRARVVDEVLIRLDVGIIRKSRVVAIDFTSADPAISAQAANALADLYIVEQLESKFEATERATNWLNDRVSSLREKVEASENAVELFRKDSGLLQSEGTTITSQQVSELNTQLVLARTARAEAEARLGQIERLVESAGGVESVAEVFDSPLIQSLREQETELRRKTAELSTEYGELHPKMINARAEVLEHQEKIKLEVSKIIKGLANEVDIARARETTMESSLGSLKREVSSANSSEVQLRALEREANADRMLLETFLSRFKETSEQQDPGLQEADARVISRAAVPRKPSWPNKIAVLATVLLAALVGGIGLVFVIEQLDQGFRSGQQIERATGVPSLGLVPMVGGLLRRARAPEAYVLKNPRSAFAEAIRTLHTSILLTHIDQPPKVVLLTSCAPREGKTSIALCLARQQASAGRKVVVIDADMRRPRVHEALQLAREPGLVDLLLGEGTFEELVQIDQDSGAEILSAGRSIPNPPDLLRSERLGGLLDRLAETHDMVIIDSPPVAVASDSRILASRAHVTVLVIRWAKTRREAVDHALGELRSAGTRIGGVVLSMVDTRRHAQYGYGDSGHYHGQAKKYYSG